MSNAEFLVTDVGIGVAISILELELAARLLEREDQDNAAGGFPTADELEGLTRRGYVAWHDGVPVLEEVIAGLVESLAVSRMVLRVATCAGDTASGRIYYVGDHVAVQEVDLGNGLDQVFSPLLTRDLPHHFVGQLFSQAPMGECGDGARLTRAEVVRSLGSPIAGRILLDTAENNQTAPADELDVVQDLREWTCIWSITSPFACLEFAVSSRGNVWLLPSAPGRDTNPTSDAAVRIDPAVCTELMTSLFPTDIAVFSAEPSGA